MKPITIPLMLLAILFLASCNSHSGDNHEQKKDADTATQTTSARPAEWHYEGDKGPANWGTLDPAYSLCADGKNQSPINIMKTESGHVDFSLDYKSTSLRIAHHEFINEILNNGHTIQVTVDSGSHLTLNGKQFNLKQFHFHAPSEHTIDGEHAPLEMHMVHQSSDGSLAVIGLLFKESTEANPNLATIIANFPAQKGQKLHLEDLQLDINQSLPKSLHAYHYVGSLTTPPCSENVQWLVLREPSLASADQLAAFSSKISPNNRPVQQLNQRMVTSFDSNVKAQ